MLPRISFVTLGVADIARSRRFYVDGLGWRAASASNEHIVFLDLGGQVLSLYGRAALAADMLASPEGSGFRGFALAHNVGSPAEVDRVLAEAVAAGATLLKPGQSVFWGGYSGYFADPDGHAWEVAYNPHIELDAEGRVRLGT